MNSIKEQTRLKVNKKVDSKTRILNLDMTYLGVFAFFALTGIVFLMVNFSMQRLIVVSIVVGAVYMFLLFLDSIDYLAKFNKSKIPNQYTNDIF